MKTNWKNLADRIPSKVKIKRAEYPILWIDKNITNNFGETRFDPKQIILAAGFSDKVVVSTYIHEILHAVSNEYDINLTENQVRKLEKSLFWLLKPDNIFKDKP